MKFQITPAPTNESAIGRKMSALATVSNLLLSASTAIRSPNTTQASVPTTSHIKLFLSEGSIWAWLLVKIGVKLPSPTKVVESESKRLWKRVRRAGIKRNKVRSSTAGPTKMNGWMRPLHLSENDST